MKIKKIINLIIAAIGFIWIGFCAGMNTSKEVSPIYFNSYIMLAGTMFILLIRTIFTNGKTKLYTQEEFENKKEEKHFDFENDTKLKPK